MRALSSYVEPMIAESHCTTVHDEILADADIVCSFAVVVLLNIVLLI